MAMPVVFVRKSRGAEIPIIKEDDEHNKILLPLHVKLYYTHDSCSYAAQTRILGLFSGDERDELDTESSCNIT